MTMKTPEELKTLKEEAETLNRKPAASEVTDEELKQVSGSFGFVPMICDTCSYSLIWSDYYSGMHECPECGNMTFHAKNK